ncbi:MAG: flavodoxin family protein, partial [Clostridia bacterium]|nr:flavodoxin family protein [Clostridia bacterium]
MKILAINGSHRGRNGYTQFLINKVLEGAASQGAEVETVTLTEHTIQRCTGCFTCQKQARLGKCIYDGKDAAAMIYNKMREADLLIFATPVYVFN